MARELARRLPQGFVLGIDRSAKAIALAKSGDGPPNLDFRQVSADAFRLAPGEEPFDLAVAIRVGALDGRHPEAEQASRTAIRAALKPGGRLYIDGGTPLREIEFPD
jgi:SAM-dependent methyltransferase